MRTVFVLMEGKPQEDLSRGALSFDLGEQTAKGQDPKQRKHLEACCRNPREQLCCLGSVWKQ